MKKNTIIQFIVTGMFLFGATACTGNFEDYNKNPHEPDQNDMGVDWYLVRSLALNLQDLMMPEQENFSQYVDCLMAGAFSGYVADSNLRFNNFSFACNDDFVATGNHSSVSSQSCCPRSHFTSE